MQQAEQKRATLPLRDSQQPPARRGLSPAISKIDFLTADSNVRQPATRPLMRQFIVGAIYCCIFAGMTRPNLNPVGKHTN
jgi:hypothetical protein